MKCFIIAILACASVTVSFAQSSEVKKVINKLDVKKQIKDLPKGNARLFWETIVKNNKRVQKLYKAAERNDKNIDKVYNDLTYGLRVLDYYDDIVSPDYSLLNKISRDLGIEEETSQYPIKIINDQSFNASMDPRGQMRINIGTINRLNYEELLAVCAHETAHNFCEHVFSRLYKNEKKRKSNEAWAGLAYGLMVGAGAISGGYAAANGFDTSAFEDFISNSEIMWEYFENDAHIKTIRYTYKYSREEELEADIIAYRFFEYMGYNTDAWISTMRKMLVLGGDYRVKSDKYDDHPTTMFRMQVLQAMKSGFEGK